ncbi:pimeloyl-ACP methyl ester carboxylesterase [Nitrosomonas sp. PY1]|uniref:alpha/beta fold hydrolase n=1 Tax=Nitrosomonas sp. PY1 TaxID=1803906 RepID=UPI001FC7F98E|nr:alpha/beta hydrolase [Nitrosomonas sp. PY1]GKS68101.1 pimeloyl-ACP methyl ester carboxylesterase [Nitrosomonas sp. PY1]
MDDSFKKLLVSTPSSDKKPRKARQIAYTDWGDPQNPHVVICAHGLTRNCRDFDYLARALESEYRVIAFDVVGRGRSDWLEEACDYNFYPLYLSDATSLIAHIQAQYNARITFDWVGISMGALIGMILSIQPQAPAMFRKLIMSDIGPLIPATALTRISDYVDLDPRFDTFEAFKTYMKKISESFGPLTDAQWNHMAIYSMREYDDGTYGFRYDPKIGISLKEFEIKDIDLWQQWDQMTVPTLVLRGTESDLLSVDTAAQMKIRGPKAQIVELPGIGHAPTIMDKQQIQIVRNFIDYP